MSKAANTCHFIGRLGKDAELRYTPSATAVLNFNLAVKDSKKEGDEFVDVTHWVNRLTVFGRRAEALSERLTKGTQVAVVCKLQEDKWEDAEGNKRSSYSFLVDDLTILSKGGGSSESSGEFYNTASNDDMPF